jgi:hypothetical protein
MTDKQTEMAFLTETFDISAPKAAALVAETDGEAEALIAQRLAEEREQSPYGDAPVPTSPEEHSVPENGGLQKTVLNRKNEAGRAGP